MKIIRKTDELQQILVLIKDKGQSIGSVLTMGNLHDGHLSLIKEAKLIFRKKIYPMFTHQGHFVYMKM